MHLTAEEFKQAFKQLSHEEQKEVFQALSAYIKEEDLSDKLYAAATDSLSELWDNEENEHWDTFLKQNIQPKN